MKALDTLKHARTSILTTAASAAAFHGPWSDDFCIKEIKRVWNNTTSVLDKPIGEPLMAEDLREVSTDDLFSLGFGRWSGDSQLLLIPIWAWNFIADGQEVISINGETKVKGTDDIDLDHRGGYLAWGFSHEGLTITPPEK